MTKQQIADTTQRIVSIMTAWAGRPPDTDGSFEGYIELTWRGLAGFRASLVLTSRQPWASVQLYTPSEVYVTGAADTPLEAVQTMFAALRHRTNDLAVSFAAIAETSAAFEAHVAQLRS